MFVCTSRHHSNVFESTRKLWINIYAGSCMYLIMINAQIVKGCRLCWCIHTCPQVCFKDAFFSLLPRMRYGLFYNTPLVSYFSCIRSCFCTSARANLMYFTCIFANGGISYFQCCLVCSLICMFLYHILWQNCLFSFIGIPSLRARWYPV